MRGLLNSQTPLLLHPPTGPYIFDNRVGLIVAQMLLRLGISMDDCIGDLADDGKPRGCCAPPETTCSLFLAVS